MKNKSFLLLISVFCFSLVLLCSACDGNKETEYKGTVEDFDDNTISLITEKGNEITFDISEAEMQCVYELEEDNYLSIFCKKSDKSHKALRVIDYPAGDGIALKGENGTVASEGSTKSVATEVMAGKIINISKDMIKLQSDTDNTVYTFTTVFAKQNYTAGAAYGTRVEVEYSGTLNAADTTGINVVSVKTEGADIEEKSAGGKTAKDANTGNTVAAGQNDETKSFYGSLVDFNGNYMTIAEAVTATGEAGKDNTGTGTDASPAKAETISLYTKNAKLDFPNGIQEGTPVTVIYKPSAAKIATNGAVSIALLKNATVVSVEGTGESCNVSVTGTVEESSSGNKLALKLCDGAPVLFKVNKAENNSVNALKAGSKVKIIFENGSYSKGKTPAALQIMDVK